MRRALFIAYSRKETHAVERFARRLTQVFNFVLERLPAAIDKDVEHMPFLARPEFGHLSESNHDSRALGCSVIIGVLISGEDDHLFPITKAFPKTTAYLKKELMLD